MTARSGAYRRPKFLYIALGCLMAALAIAGFWPSYFGHLPRGTLDQPLVIHFHAVVFTGWLVIVIAQAWLAAAGRVALHRRLGTFLFVYGAILIVVGWYTALDVFATRVAAGETQQAKAGLFVPVTDLLFFAPLLFAAWAYRRNPEIHKRLIVVATTALLIAAAHRLIGAHIGKPPPPGPVLMVWLSPILIGLIYDVGTRRLVHPVYVLGIAVVFAMKF
ncbi:MAG TPA: hypothetical protein VEA16_10265, partial [Vicinamibacterales bacterium]|nr:hypothetical protein [Vicinamibacterales bacterium]